MTIEIGRFPYPDKVSFIASYPDGQTREVYLSREDFLVLADKLEKQGLSYCEGVNGGVGLAKRNGSVIVDVHICREVGIFYDYDPNDPPSPRATHWEKYSMPLFEVECDRIQRIIKELTEKKD